MTIYEHVNLLAVRRLVQHMCVDLDISMGEAADQIGMSQSQLSEMGRTKKHISLDTYNKIVTWLDKSAKKVVKP